MSSTKCSHLFQRVTDMSAQRGALFPRQKARLIISQKDSSTRRKLLSRMPDPLLQWEMRDPVRFKLQVGVTKTNPGFFSLIEYFSYIIHSESNSETAFNADTNNNFQRGGYRGRRGFGGRNYHGVKRGGVDTHYQRDEKSKVNFQAPQQVWACIFCQVGTHLTVDCRKLGRAREMFQDQYPKQEKGFPASACFAARSIFDWFADSGATSHMTDQRSLMTNYIPITPGSWMVPGIGGASLPVHGQGEITVITEVCSVNYVYLKCSNKRFLLGIL